uniref:CASP-like protein n=1 Tax=Oryza barthii TaxID=65489 RepID=A0A0D3GM52_9ORYZ
MASNSVLFATVLAMAVVLTGSSSCQAARLLADATPPAVPALYMECAAITMASTSGLLATVLAMAVLLAGSSRSCQAARHLADATPPAAVPVPAMPAVPNAALPPMPAVPKVTLPPMPSMPAVPKVTLPPMPSVPMPVLTIAKLASH